MRNDLLTDADQKEFLSRTYVTAVATRAGYITSIPVPDRDGIDLRIQGGGVMRPALDLQLKATASLRSSHNGMYRFDLPRSNYDTLRLATQTPRLLVVLDLPSDQRQWLSVSTDQLTLRRAAYWTSLADCSESDNKSSVTVSVPASNLFDVRAVRALMEQSRKGVI